MDLAKDFVFKPLPAIDDSEDVLTAEAEAPSFQTFAPTAVAPAAVTPAAKAKTTSLGRLAGLRGKWEGTGFNVIWRPNFHPEIRHFLELNRTTETVEFQEIQGAIPNRGLLQKDIDMFGLHYLQQISDANLGAGLHFEPGIWARVPATTHPRES